MVMVATESASVGSSRLATSSATVFLKKNDSPKSPRSRLPSQMKNCVTIGSSSPSRLRMAAICSALALSPAMMAAGFPRREAQHQEHEPCDDQHHRRGGNQTAQDVAEHASASAAGGRRVRRRRLHDHSAARAAAQLQHPYLLMFQNTGAGALRMPFTFLRAPIG
jgi:hypothetical protein